MTIATRNNSTTKKFVLNKRSDTVTVEGVGPDDWILVSTKVDLYDTGNFPSFEQD